MIVAKWREGFSGLFRGADAQKVADEISAIGEAPTAADIVDAARNEDSELHKCFEWDDSRAAELWRLKQARDVVHHLVYVEEKIPVDRPEIRIRYMDNTERGYKETKKIVRNEDSYKALLAQAYSELRAFKARYSMLSELAEILDLIQ